MCRIEYSSTFKKEYKRSMKRGHDMTKFENVIELLANENTYELDPTRYDRLRALSSNHAVGR